MTDRVITEMFCICSTRVDIRDILRGKKAKRQRGFQEPRLFHIIRRQKSNGILNNG